jgi:hypothetical protein
VQAAVIVAVTGNADCETSKLCTRSWELCMRPIRPYLYECRSESYLEDFPGPQPVFIICCARGPYATIISTKYLHQSGQSREHPNLYRTRYLTNHPRNQRELCDSKVVCGGGTARTIDNASSELTSALHPRRSLAAAFSPKCYLHMIPTFATRWVAHFPP